MDRKTLLAIGLMLIVAILPSLLFPPEEQPSPVAPDSIPMGAVIEEPAAPAAVPTAAQDALPPAPDTMIGVVNPPRADAVDVVVASELYRFTFTSMGARITRADLIRFRSTAVGDTGVVSVLPPGSELMQYRMVMGSDTLEFADLNFVPSDTLLSVTDGDTRLSWTGSRGATRIELTYTFRPDSYLFDVEGRVVGTGSSTGLMLIGLGPRVARTEKDTVGNARSFGVVTKSRSIDNLKFRSLDPGERHAIEGPFDWIAVKSKYFLTAILTVEEGMPRLGGAVAVGGPRATRTATDTDVIVSLPAPGGQFSHSVYVGPQEFRRLSAIGHDLEEVNPYGAFLGPVVSPFAKIVVVILIWMHENLRLPYGWVLVTFGIAVRLLLWPLNQKSMRSSMAMQAIQPEIKSLQEKFKGDPTRLQQEMMKLYKEHGVNPIGGCLPALLPMPILFALFFVFQNTIELRGVSFLWLPDLSGPDPLLITPIVMAASMYALFKIGQIGVPPNPQTKMMLYMMPAMFLFFGIKFPAGLNVYYAVSNLASLPQQWLVAQERLARTGKKT